MARQMVCPSCGEADELTGRPGDQGIVITCDRCGTSWPREAAPPTCVTCGGTDLEHRPQPTTAYSRGTQVSIVGWRQIPLCVTCDAPMLSRSLAGKLIPNGYVPAAVRRRDSDEPDPGQHTILPR